MASLHLGGSPHRFRSGTLLRISLRASVHVDLPPHRSAASSVRQLPHGAAGAAASVGTARAPLRAAVVPGRPGAGQEIRPHVPPLVGLKQVSRKDVAKETKQRKCEN